MSVLSSSSDQNDDVIKSLLKFEKMQLRFSAMPTVYSSITSHYNDELESKLAVYLLAQIIAYSYLHSSYLYILGKWILNDMFF